MVAHTGRKLSARGLALLCLGTLVVAGCGEEITGEGPGSFKEASQTREQAESALKAAGAKMEIRKYPIGNAWSIDLSGKEVSDEIVTLLVQLPYLSELNVSGTNISDAQLERIAREKGKFVVQLDVSNTPISDQGIAVINDLPQLRQLNVKGSKVSSNRVIELLREREKSQTVASKKVKLQS
ncbi:MAG: hypothetical protein ACT4QC_23735 [Planctomycetaceae bacterium]